MLIVFSYAVILAIEFVLVAWVHRGDAAPAASASQLFKAWFAEAVTAPRIFCWQQPFRSRRYPDHLPVQTGRRGVVLVHGFVCNRGFWNRWMPKLLDQGVPFVAVNLEPVFGSISNYDVIIEAAVRRIEQATGQAPVIVGHSMGGLAIRAWMSTHRGSHRIHRAITIGSPHHGTWLARFGMSRNSREMAQATVWQTALHAKEAAPLFERYTCFYSNCDNVVFPASTATLPGADNRHIPGIAHVQLADHAAVFDEVLVWTREGKLA